MRTLEESLTIIKFKPLVYTKLITTPHIISDNYPNTKAIIQKNFLQHREALKNEQMHIEAGAEPYVDIKFL